MKRHNKRLSKKWYLIGGVIGLVLIVLGGWFVYVSTTPKTYPLGDKLEYVGVTYSGTVFFGDSAPSESYYYATDMTPKEVAAYFKRATVDEPNDLDAINPTPPITFSLHAVSTDNPIYVYYYPDIKTKTNEFKLKKTNKQHLVIIQNEDYQAAKASL